jgi:hypothetical protein
VGLLGGGGGFVAKDNPECREQCFDFKATGDFASPRTLKTSKIPLGQMQTKSDKAV